MPWPESTNCDNCQGKWGYSALSAWPREEWCLNMPLPPFSITSCRDTLYQSESFVWNAKWLKLSAYSHHLHTWFRFQSWLSLSRNSFWFAALCQYPFSTRARDFISIKLPVISIPFVAGDENHRACHWRVPKGAERKDLPPCNISALPGKDRRKAKRKYLLEN